MINQTLDIMTKLRLKDMAKEYRRQTELPSMDSLSFDERFSMIIEEEWLGRNNRKFKRLLKEANLPEADACIENIDYDPIRGIDRAQIARLSGCNWVNECTHLLITGKTGTGKTWMASAFANAACRNGHKVKCFKTIRLLNELTAGRNDGSWIKRLNNLLLPKLIILDDFGMEPLDAIHCRDLFEIIDERKNRGAIIISSQLPVRDWHNMLADKTAANAVLDRVVNNSNRIELCGPSRRRIVNAD